MFIMENAIYGQILLSGFVIGIIVFQTALAAPIVFVYLEKTQSRFLKSSRFSVCISFKFNDCK